MGWVLEVCVDKVRPKVKQRSYRCSPRGPRKEGESRGWYEGAKEANTVKPER